MKSLGKREKRRRGTAFLLSLVTAAGILWSGTTGIRAYAEENPSSLMLGIFFNSQEDMSDTLYVSFNGIDFYSIGMAYEDAFKTDSSNAQCTESPSLSPRSDFEKTWYVNCLHDPGLIYKDGYFWSLSGFTQECDGRWTFTPMLGCSSDLVNWSFPGSGSSTNIVPVGTMPYARDGSRTNTQFDAVAPDMMLDDDGTVWMVVAMGYYSQFHGEDSKYDKDSIYLIRVDGLTPGSTDLTTRDNKAKAPKVTYSDAVPVNLPDSCDNRIDPSLYKENGKYYLAVKKNGITDEIWEIDSLSLDSVQNSANWTCVNSSVTKGSEGPCLTKYEGEYFYYTDGLENNEDNVVGNSKTGIQVCRSTGLDDPFTKPVLINTVDANGNAIPARHGTVMSITDSAVIEKVMSRYRANGYSYDSSMNTLSDLPDGWRYLNDKEYWYEGDVRQGTSSDPKNLLDSNGNPRGREICDPDSKAWYWFNANDNGAKAVDTDVFIPYFDQSDSMTASNHDAEPDSYGKWVHYDEV